VLPDKLSKLVERIRFHYEKQTTIEEFTDVRRADIENFEPIPYTAILENVPIPEGDSEIDDLAKKIGIEVTNLEFSHFLSSLKKIACKNVETTLDGLIERLNQTHDELWDLGFDIEQLFMPMVLKNEIRRRKQSVDIGIDFSTQTIKPIIANELGHGEIVFANRHCFDKTYPMTIDKQILVSSRKSAQNSEINCQIVQNLHYRNFVSMRKIIVTDAENSEFLNSNN
jgi:hypothetical protein